jgi:hypothetical protein
MPTSPFAIGRQSNFLLSQQKYPMLACEQLKHGKHRPGHIARVDVTFQGLPCAGLLTASAASLHRITHQGSRLNLAQPGGHPCSFQFGASWRRHVDRWVRIHVLSELTAVSTAYQQALENKKPAVD